MSFQQELASSISIASFLYSPIRLYCDVHSANISRNHLLGSSNDFQLRPHLTMLLHNGVFDVFAKVARQLLHGGLHSTCTRITRWKYQNSKTQTGGHVRNLVADTLTQAIFYPFVNEASQYLFAQRYQRNTSKDMPTVRTFSGFVLFPFIELCKRFTYFFTTNMLVHNTRSNSKAMTFASATCGVMVGSVVWYPLSTVRRAMVMQEVINAEKRLRADTMWESMNMWTFATSLYSSKGLKGFYDGYRVEFVCVVVPSLASLAISVFLPIRT